MLSPGVQVQVWQVFTQTFISKSVEIPPSGEENSLVGDNVSTGTNLV